MYIHTYIHTYTYIYTQAPYNSLQPRVESLKKRLISDNQKEPHQGMGDQFWHTFSYYPLHHKTGYLSYCTLVVAFLLGQVTQLKICEEKKERTNNLIRPYNYNDEQHLPKWCSFEQQPHGSKALLLAALEQSRRKEPCQAHVKQQLQHWCLYWVNMMSSLITDMSLPPNKFLRQQAQCYFLVSHKIIISLFFMLLLPISCPILCQILSPALSAGIQYSGEQHYNWILLICPSIRADILAHRSENINLSHDVDLSIRFVEIQSLLPSLSYIVEIQGMFCPSQDTTFGFLHATTLPLPTTPNLDYVNEP